VPDIFADTILEASYEDVKFPVSDEEAELGNDSVDHVAYLRPGAEIEPTGWKARSGSMTAVLFNDIEDDLWPGRYNQLIDVVRRKPLGSLVHPVEGLMTAIINSIHRTTTAQDRSGVRLKISWKEHNASASSLASFSNATRVDTPDIAAKQAAAADEAMALAAPSGGYTSVLSTILAELDALETQVRTVSEIESSLRIMESAVTEQIESSLFADITGYDAVVALVSLRASIVRLRPRYLPDASLIRQYVVPVTMSAWAVSLQVYGNANKADLILTANCIPDVLFIAAGSVLQILPIESNP
jgi:Mu-like prophage DNA circulation protein